MGKGGKIAIFPVLAGFFNPEPDIYRSFSGIIKLEIFPVEAERS